MVLLTMEMPAEQYATLRASSNCVCSRKQWYAVTQLGQHDGRCILLSTESVSKEQSPNLSVWIPLPLLHDCRSYLIGPSCRLPRRYIHTRHLHI